MVKSWDGVERLLEHALDNVVKTSAKQHPILMSDAPGTSEADRAKMTELLFEKFETPAYFVGTDAVLSVYSAGRTSSMFLDCGYGLTSAMLVHEGFIYPTTLQMLSVGGQDLSTYLCELLRDKGALDAAPSAITVANDIKERHARVAVDYAQASFQERGKTGAYVLPDGTAIPLQSEPLRCAEALFQPALMGRRGTGITDMVLDVIHYCDTAASSDDSPIKALTNFLLVCGGGARLPGLEERIVHDVAARHRNREFYVSCFDEPERHHAAWLGGSVLASLPAFVQNNFMSKAEYHESGASFINQKCC